VEVVFTLIAFFALVASWFALPATPRPRPKARETVRQAPAETLAPAA
jgi:hypothetical protein